MKNQLAASLVIGALILPVAGYAQTVSKAAAEVKESVTDTVITSKIKSAYARDKLVRARSVKVDTDSKGVVTLSGNARSQAEADQAVKIASGTKGALFAQRLRHGLTRMHCLTLSRHEIPFTGWSKGR